MRIAMNGMGGAGPTLAYWLRRSGHDPVHFEKAPACRSRGYLIDFCGLGYEIAERMGILLTLREHSYEMEQLQMVDRDGRDEARCNDDEAVMTPDSAMHLRQWNGPKNAAEAIWQRDSKGDVA
jgi:2-polyprenyl-6-methoxyphenol hydroxylase-like FAD-dependent oxidoreductase